MMVELKKGLFITFEGGEGCGKTTLIKKIVEKLEEKKIPFIQTREPGGTKLGEKIRSLVLFDNDSKVSPYAELALYLAARAQHVEEIILPALRGGKLVLCDRFSDSTIAYQGEGRGLGVQEVEKLCLFFTQGLVPDQTFYLDLPPEEGFHRIRKDARSYDRLESEEIKFHEKVRQAFLSLSKKDPKRFQSIDARKSPEDVFNLVWTKLTPFLPKDSA